MFSRQVLISSLLILWLVAAVVTNLAAQTSGNHYFGDKDQPGNRLHIKIMELVDAGIVTHQAINDAINTSLTNIDNTLTGEAKSAVAFDLPLANQFYDEMVQVNSLIDVSKTLIELNNDKAVHIITLGIVLYPEFAQEVFDGAALTGVMDLNDILVAALQAGADPSRVSVATAAGFATLAPPAATPLGAGIGAGGTGGGDTTASTN
jgi:hypothetical protein